MTASKNEENKEKKIMRLVTKSNNFFAKKSKAIFRNYFVNPNFHANTSTLFVLRIARVKTNAFVLKITTKAIDCTANHLNK